MEPANGGTLFLDEIGGLPMPFQGKLRVIQGRIVQRIGSTRAVRVDFRLVNATNRNLLAEVRAGRFREDLFYRLHVFPIYLPPFRQRAADIPLLAEHFVRCHSADRGRRLAGIAPAAVEVLMCYPWPGNIRELENVIQRALARKTGGAVLDLRDLSGLIERSGGSADGPPLASDGFPAAITPLEDHIRAYIAHGADARDRSLDTVSQAPQGRSSRLQVLTSVRHSFRASGPRCGCPDGPAPGGGP